MPIYVYLCNYCQKQFEAMCELLSGDNYYQCPKCGRRAPRIPAPVNHTFGWRLSDESHIKGNKDELVRDI